MKYFSVSFFQQKDDYPGFNLKRSLASLLNPEMMIRVVIGIFLAVAIYMTADASVAVFALISFLVIPVVANEIYNSSRVNSYFKYKITKRPITIDFYNDHIVYTFERNEKYKGIYERHYGFDTLQAVAEFEKIFNLAFKNESVIIPKRALSEEQTQMVYNLIDNYFKDKYVKMK